MRTLLLILTLATTVDNTYTVTFFLSGNPAGGPLAKTLTVGASGADPASYTFDVDYSAGPDRPPAASGT